MRAINDKIRNGIANAYYLKGQALDPKIDREKSFEIHEQVKQIDKKILFYKHLNNALKEIENEEYKNVGKKSL